MPTTETNNLVEVEEQRRFWQDARARNIFNLFVQGKDINFISETLSIRPATVESLITNKYFIVKLETYLRGIMFTNQVARVIASADVFSKLWDRVRDNIDQIPPEICLKELTKLFPQKREGVIINPKHMNVFMKVMKGEATPEELGKRLMDIDEDMGYQGLNEDPDADYPELGEGQDYDGEQQGDPGMDPEEQSQDE